MPHVLPVREALWDFDSSEVLDALLQLLLGGHLLLGSFPLRVHKVAGSGRAGPQQVRPAPHLGLLQCLGWPLLHNPVQRLGVGLARRGTDDDGLLRRAGLRLGLGAGRGEFIKGRPALTLALALLTLTAALAMRGRPGRRTTSPRSPHLLHPTLQKHKTILLLTDPHPTSLQMLYFSW